MATVIEQITVNLEVVDSEPLVLEGLKPWNTALDVKSAACKKASELGLQICTEGGDVDVVMCGHLTLRHSSVFLDDTTTLDSLYEQTSSPYPFLNMCLHPWRNSKFMEEVEEYVRCLHECKRVRIELDNSPDGVDTSRPKQLPERAQDLRIHGLLKLTSKYGGTPDLPHSELHDAARAYTNATVVLLAPNDRILDMLSLPKHIKSEYLIVRLSWDMLSYFFVRLMRSSYPDLPMVAVTDLDPHHLDLFTFLDTPFDDLEPCYGWDVHLDPDDPWVYGDEVVDIYWLGLRPSQCINYPLHTSSSPFDELAHPSDRGFYKVIRMLKVNPRFREKSHWLNALDWFEVHGKRVLFHPCSSAPLCESSLFLDDGFISKKVSEKDWV